MEYFQWVCICISIWSLLSYSLQDIKQTLTSKKIYMQSESDRYPPASDYMIQLCIHVSVHKHNFKNIHLMFQFVTKLFTFLLCLLSGNIFTPLDNPTFKSLNVELRWVSPWLYECRNYMQELLYLHAYLCVQWRDERWGLIMMIIILHVVFKRLKAIMIRRRK